jgi:Zn-dependent protease
MQGPLSIFYFLILIFSIIVHEVAHGVVAEREGDPTARMLGRITLNPLKHIDLFGSILLPAILIFTNAGFVVGWAKPVPYNPDNLRNGNRSIAKVSIAGIVVNLTIAIVFGLLMRASLVWGFGVQSLLEIGSIIVFTNIILALFNAMPFAPLDGFRFLNAVLPRRFAVMMAALERFSLPLLLIFVVFGWKVVAPFAFVLFKLLTGISL